MSDAFTWKARTRGCQCCKWKDQRIAELEPELAGQSAELGAAKRKIAELEAENKMLKQLAKAEAMAAVKAE
jgi:hypothetical protein